MSSSQHKLILRTAISYLRSTVKADRAIAVYEGYAYAHGFAADTLWERADLSQGIIESLLAKNTPTVITDALVHPDFSQRTSTVLSNIGAVIFLPVKDGGGVTRGFLYLDQQRQNKFPLTKGILERIQDYVTGDLEPMFHSLVEPLTWKETLKVEWISIGGA